MAQDYDWRYLNLSKYYIPSVSPDGILSWTPSDPSMPAVPAAKVTGPEGKVGIRGPQGIPGIAGVDGTVAFDSLTASQLQMITGPKGECGVHVGENAPSSGDRYIWIDTDDEIDGELATKEYVDNAIVKQLSSGEVELDTYATKVWVNDRLVSFVTKSMMSNTMAEYYTKAQIDGILSDWAAAQGVPSSEEVNY